MPKLRLTIFPTSIPTYKFTHFSHKWDNRPSKIYTAATGCKKSLRLSCPFRQNALLLQGFSGKHPWRARGVAQLVAHLVWDQVVARSSRVTPTTPQRSGRHRIPPKCLEEQNKRRTFAQPFQNGALDEWLSQRSAKPCTAVRIRQAPLHKRTRQRNGILFLRMPLFLCPRLNPQREPPRKTRHAHVTWPASHLAGLHGKPEWSGVKPRLVMKRGIRTSTALHARNPKEAKKGGTGTLTPATRRMSWGKTASEGCLNVLSGNPHSYLVPP